MKEEVIYGVCLQRSKEGHVSVAYKGVELNGVVDAKIEMEDNGPLLTLKIKPDAISSDVLIDAWHRSPNGVTKKGAPKSVELSAENIAEMKRIAEQKVIKEFV